MNDYWNDPPEPPEVPECCDQPMRVEETTGACVCEVCGKRIEPERDPPSEPITDDDRMVNFPPKCPHGKEWFACDACDWESDFRCDCERERRLK